MAQVSLHVSFIHSFVNPLLFLVLHKTARSAALDMICCSCSRSSGVIHIQRIVGKSEKEQKIIYVVFKESHQMRVKMARVGRGE
jgi:hypothetical protein